MNKFKVLEINIDSEKQVMIDFNNQVIEEFYTNKQDFFDKLDKEKLMKFVQYVCKILSDGDITNRK